MIDILDAFDEFIQQKREQTLTDEQLVELMESSFDAGALSEIIADRMPRLMPAYGNRLVSVGWYFDEKKKRFGQNCNHPLKEFSRELNSGK